jgi:leucyl aminopeptidase
MAKIQFQKREKLPSDKIFIVSEKTFKAKSAGISEYEADYVKEQHKDGKKFIEINNLSSRMFFYFTTEHKESWKALEACRVAGSKATKYLNEQKVKSIAIVDLNGKNSEALAFVEGMALSNYQFLKYFTNKEKRKNALELIAVSSSEITKDSIEELNDLVSSVFAARDLVNEPFSYLTAEKLGESAEDLGKACGIKVEVFNHKKIQALRMGGLLAVNSGSNTPPTFTIMEYKPKDAVNKKPYVLVGKGVVFDTGGVNIKVQNMELMKADMGGAAAVIGAITAIAKQKLPAHVIALIPATDNRPGEDAYVPGNVLTMFDGTTVEVLNTDAEGRLILADALAYAKKYKPELVIDLATLTGAALRSVGIYGMPVSGTADEKIMSDLKKIGYDVYERMVEFPLWEEYGEEIKSQIADLKNIGSIYGGQVTAAKFLEHFTDYPWIHLDIAGPSYFEKDNHYRLFGGSGYGVRLLYHFIKSQTQIVKSKKK